MSIEKDNEATTRDLLYDSICNELITKIACDCCGKDDEQLYRCQLDTLCLECIKSILLEERF